MNHQEFLQLIERIQTGSKRKFDGEQLACICQLVYYCGLAAKEVPKLKVGEVVDKNGAVIGDIKSGDAATIHLNDEARAAIERYIGQLRQNLPSFTHIDAWLFPSYRNTDKLKRDLKRFAADCSMVKKSGYFFFYQNEKRKGSRETRIYKEGGKQLRVTARQFRAVATGNKIRPGKTVDNRCIEQLFGLQEEAERLDKKAPNASEMARGIMARFEQIVASMRNQGTRDNYGRAIEKSLEEVLGGLI